MFDMIADSRFMRQALVLARQGLGYVSPNPLVGCVIVDNGKIIAEGYHQKYGGPHAEAHALRALQTRRARGATVYVNLEPCAHVGKTPPCADALIAARVKRVVVGIKDPNPLVAGKGIKKLRAAGIAVNFSEMRRECEEINEVFVTWIQTKQPFVLLKCAVSLDGAMTLKKGMGSRMSSSLSLQRVHELRQEYDAIGVGVESVVIDNPRLTTRKPGKRRNPVRVIFDTSLRIPVSTRLFREKGKTIIFTGPACDKKKKEQLTNQYQSVRIVPVALDEDGHPSLREALCVLGEGQITSIMIEGGQRLARSFLHQGLVDKLMLTITPHVATDAGVPRLFFGQKGDLQFIKTHWEMVGSDAWFTGYPVHEVHEVHGG